MSKECLDLIFSILEEKAKNMRMWKGSKKTKNKFQKKYLKVSYTV